MVVGTMNVIDCLAIAPYYLTLFFFPAPEMGPVDGDLPTQPPGVIEEEEGESSFGNVGRIMQVRIGSQLELSILISHPIRCSGLPGS